ncbi:MAG: hypothetical protein HFJ41_03835 [Clostridia bacterium]|nr:hypothetical protein [Clostridia bacterium]
MKCIECKYCKQIGRQQSQKARLGRKTYYCKNPKVYKMKDEKGYPLYNFIGFGDTTIESPLKLKTSKKWCPLKGEKE